MCSGTTTRALVAAVLLMAAAMAVAVRFGPQRGAVTVTDATGPETASIEVGRPETVERPDSGATGAGLSSAIHAGAPVYDEAGARIGHIRRLPAGGDRMAVVSFETLLHTGLTVVYVPTDQLSPRADGRSLVLRGYTLPKLGGMFLRDPG